MPVGPTLRVLGVVLARGGSKRLPGKNIKDIAGKPLLAWTAEALTTAKRIDRCVLSTDDEAIADCGRRSGLEVPGLRPAHLADDHASSLDVLRHVWQSLADDGYAADWVVLAQPTSPLRLAEDFDAAIELALRRQADCVVGVSPMHPHPLTARRMGGDGRLSDRFDRAAEGLGGQRSQDREALWAVNGAVYVIGRTTLIERQSLYGDRTFGYPMPSERAIDIDDAWQFRLAEHLLNDRLTEVTHE